MNSALVIAALLAFAPLPVKAMLTARTEVVSSPPAMNLVMLTLLLLRVSSVIMALLMSSVW